MAYYRRGAGAVGRVELDDRQRRPRRDILSAVRCRERQQSGARAGAGNMRDAPRGGHCRSLLATPTMAPLTRIILRRRSFEYRFGALERFRHSDGVVEVWSSTNAFDRNAV